MTAAPPTQAARTRPGGAPTAAQAKAKAGSPSSAAPDGAGAAGGSKRWRPIGAGTIERLSTPFLFACLLVLLGYAYLSTRPLHHLFGSEISVEVLQVIDGDTFTAKTASGVVARFRLRNVDAPEREQPYYLEAKEILAQLLLGEDGEGGGGGVGQKKKKSRDVIVFVWEQDDWSRYIVDVVYRDAIYTKITFVQEEMIKKGAAWYFGAGTGALADAMKEARKDKVGLWRASENPVEPWRHRYNMRKQREAPKGPSLSHSRDDREGGRSRLQRGKSSSTSGRRSLTDEDETVARQHRQQQQQHQQRRKRRGRG